jgi:hypothetical protein
MRKLLAFRPMIAVRAYSVNPAAGDAPKGKKRLGQGCSPRNSTWTVPVSGAAILPNPVTPDVSLRRGGRGPLVFCI